MPFAIEYSDEATDDLAAIRPFDRVRIIDEITGQLTHQPTVVTKHRKPVVNAAELTGLGATWELQVGDYRVLYDIVPETQVLIIRVIFKGTMTLGLALDKSSNNEE